MRYKVSGQRNRHFLVTNDNQDTVAKLDYTAWMPNRAHITVGDAINYDLAPTGFFHTGISITRNGSSFATLKANWRSNIVMNFENGTNLVFKKKSLWKNDYIVVNDDEQEIASINSEFKWSELNFVYEIEVQDNQLDPDVAGLLPALLTYCTRYLRMRHAAAT